MFEEEGYFTSVFLVWSVCQGAATVFLGKLKSRRTAFSAPVLLSWIGARAPSVVRSPPSPSLSPLELSAQPHWFLWCVCVMPQTSSLCICCSPSTHKTPTFPSFRLLLREALPSPSTWNSSMPQFPSHRRYHLLFSYLRSVCPESRELVFCACW